MTIILLVIEVILIGVIFKESYDLIFMEDEFRRFKLNEYRKKYLEKRVKNKSISDGRWEVYIKQKESFESPTVKENFVEIDVSNKDYEYQIDVFHNILKKLS